MSKSILRYIFLCLFLFPYFGYAQNIISRQIDSLEQQVVKMPDDTSKINKILTLCLFLNKESSHEKVIVWATKALKLAQKLSYTDGQAKAYSYIGTSLRKSGNYYESISNYKKSETLLKQSNNKTELSSLYNRIGVTYWRMGLYPRAQNCFFQSLKIAEEIHDSTGIANAWGNLGLVYHNNSQFTEALTYHLKALDYYFRTNNKKEIAASYTNLGNIFSAKGIPEKALVYYKKSLDIKKQIEDREGTCIALVNICNELYTLGNYLECNQYAQEALVIATEINSKFHIIEIQILMAKLNLKLNQSLIARKYAESALAHAKEIMSNEMLSSAYTYLSQVDSSEKKWERAYLNYRMAIQYRDSVYNDENRVKISEQAMQYEYDKKESIQKAEQDKKDALAAEEVKKQNIIRNTLIFGISVVVVISIILYKNYQNKKRDNEIINSQKLLVETKNKEILQSLSYAKRIQGAILPPARIISKFIPDWFILYLPKDIVAGDFYWIEREGNKTYIAVCDCTGHGVPGALVSVVCYNALNTAFNEFIIREPGKLLDKTRDLVVESFTKSDEDVNDGMDTSLICIDFDTKECQWSGANNPLWIVRKVWNGTQHSPQLIEIKPDKQPIGKGVGDRNFTTHNFTLQSEDMVYLFTDGYADQFGGEKNRKLNKSNLKELLVENYYFQQESQKENLLNFHNSYKGNHEQIDDICIIGIKIS